MLLQDGAAISCCRGGNSAKLCSGARLQPILYLQQAHLGLCPPALQYRGVCMSSPDESQVALGASSLQAGIQLTPTVMLLQTTETAGKGPLLQTLRWGDVLLHKRR